MTNHDRTVNEIGTPQADYASRDAKIKAVTEPGRFPQNSDNKQTTFQARVLTLQITAIIINSNL